MIFKQQESLSVLILTFTVKDDEKDQQESI